jgi:hypothetical protein
MSVKQFNGKYLPNDDRIIFRFNTVDHSEFAFWLTRRITHYILMSADLFVEKEYQKLTPSVEKVISEIQQAEKPATNFTQAYEAGTKYPIGGDAVLVMDAKCQIITIDNKNVFSLDFILPAGANVNIKITVPVMKSLILLLEELNVQAKWGNPISKYH